MLTVIYGENLKYTLNFTKYYFMREKLHINLDENSSLSYWINCCLEAA